MPYTTSELIAGSLKNLFAIMSIILCVARAHEPHGVVFFIPSPFMTPSLWPRLSSACKALFDASRRTYAYTGYVGGFWIPWDTLAPNALHVKPWPWVRLMRQADARNCAPAGCLRASSKGCSVSKNIRARRQANRDYSNGLLDTQDGPTARYRACRNNEERLIRRAGIAVLL